MENFLQWIVWSLWIFVWWILLYLLIKSIVFKAKPTNKTEAVMWKIDSIKILPVDYQYQESSVSYINPISIGFAQILTGLMWYYVKQYLVIWIYTYSGKTYNFETYIIHQNINFNNIFKKFNAEFSNKVSVKINPQDPSEYCILQDQFYKFGF